MSNNLTLPHSLPIASLRPSGEKHSEEISPNES